MSWICSTCQQSHEGMPLSFAADYPDNYANMSAEDRETRALISSDQCILDESECYLRGMIQIPIHDSPDPFLWGVWASMSPEDFYQVDQAWELEGRENTTGPYKGRLANRLVQYEPTTLNLPLRIEIQPVGARPFFFIEEPDHPLAIAQREGMTLAQAQKLAEAALHSRRLA